MRGERFGRGEECGRRVVSSECPGEVLRDAEGRKRRNRRRAPDLQKFCTLVMCWRERVVAHLHGLYRIVRLLDGVDFYPLSRVRQKELIDDLYLVIGGLDGSESLRRRHLMRSMMTTSIKPGLSNVTRLTVPRDTVLKRVARP